MQDRAQSGPDGCWIGAKPAARRSCLAKDAPRRVVQAEGDILYFAEGLSGIIIGQ